MCAVRIRGAVVGRSRYRFRAAFVCWLTGFALSLCAPGLAHAAPGFGLGPVIAITASDTPALGWELSVVGSNPVYARAALGGSYSWSVAEGDPQHFHYLVAEPWLYVGATLGLAVADHLQPRVVYGAWEGVGVSLDSDVFNTDERQWVVSLALGWRAVGSTHQFYLTPKLFRMNGWRLNS